MDIRFLLALASNLAGRFAGFSGEKVTNLVEERIYVEELVEASFLEVNRPDGTVSSNKLNVNFIVKVTSKLLNILFRKMIAFENQFFECRLYVRQYCECWGFNIK